MTSKSRHSENISGGNGNAYFTNISNFVEKVLTKLSVSGVSFRLHWKINWKFSMWEIEYHMF